MPYVIKPKTDERYLCGTTSNKADFDDNGLVSLDYARIYPTEAGAKSSMKHWAKKWDHNVIDIAAKTRFVAQGMPDSVAESVARGGIVVDDAKLNLVEVVQLCFVK